LKSFLTRLAVGLSVFAVMAGIGAAISTQIAAERLRDRIEADLSQGLGGDARIGETQLVFAPWPELVASDVEIWLGPRGANLQVPRVSARVGLLPLLAGQVRLTRVVLDGARLRIERLADGRWNPDALSFLSPVEPPEGERENPDEFLQPLIALEVISRLVLSARPLFSDSVEVRNGRIAFVDRRVDASLGEGPERVPLTLALHGLQGKLSHRRLRGDARLELRARLVDRTGERGSVEWRGRRLRSGGIRIAMAATDLQLDAIEPYMREWLPNARVDGGLSGALIYETPEAGQGRLELDLALREFHARATPAADGTFGPLDLERVTVGAVLAISPERVHLEQARIEGKRLRIEGDGVIERPMEPSSEARLSLSFHDVSVGEARDLLGWVPTSDRLDLAALLEPIEDGRLVRFVARGAAPLAGWKELFEGRTLTLPLGFTGEAELAGVRARVGPKNRLDELRGHLSWGGDRLALRDAGALLNGAPLPRPAVSIEGVSNLFAPAAHREAVAFGGQPLLGLKPLWDYLQPSGEPGGSPTSTVFEVEIEALDHPMFLWPIRGFSGRVEVAERGVQIAASQGRWAGVPIRVEGEWLFEPEEMLRLQLEASAPARAAAAQGDTDPSQWARGRFRVGAIEGSRWRQRTALGRFRATESRVEIDEVDVELAPTGRLTGRVGLDLSQPEHVPFDFEVDVTQGDVAVLSRTVGLPENSATGSIELIGSLRGRFRPGQSLFAHAVGSANLDATDGRIERTIPSVVVLALASESFNPAAGSESIRYDRVKAELEFSDGIMRSDNFHLDGPDLRVLAEGGVDVARRPHEMSVEVALFLFRQLDRAIDMIPLVSVLLLGSDEGLLAAYYELEGPWAAPEAKLVPLRSLAMGPGAVVFEGVPMVAGVPKLVLQGIRAIQSALDLNMPTQAPEGGARSRTDLPEESEIEPPEAEPTASLDEAVDS
jgi:hypothetical protein